MTKVRLKQNKRRTEILEAAIPLLTRGDFEELGIAEICREIGISTGSFYHYFTKKSDLLIGLVRIIDEDMEERVFPLLTSEDETENLRRFAHGWAEHVSAHGIERSKLISAINPESEAFPEQERSSVRKLHEVIAAGQAKGQITADCPAEELSDFFLQNMRSVTLDWSRRNGSYPLVERMDACTRLALRAFRP